MSAQDLRKALESDEAMCRYYRDGLPGPAVALSKQLRADILALIEEEKKAAGFADISREQHEAIQRDIAKQRLDAYVQAALTGLLANPAMIKIISYGIEIMA